MTTEVIDNTYILNLNVDSFEIKIYFLKGYIGTFIFMIVFMQIPFLCISLLGFLKQRYFYAYFFLIFFLIIAFGLSYGLVNLLNDKKYFSFIVDKHGICLTRKNYSYSMLWGDVSSFGYVKDVINSGVKTSSRQMCLYFSKRFYSETELRTNLSDFRYDKYSNIEKNELVAFGFRKNEINVRIRNSMDIVISRYCSSKKRINYLNED